MTKKSYPLIEQIIAHWGFDLQHIEDIYSGKNHWCRCGCGGEYYKPENKSFKSVLSRLERMLRDNCANSEVPDGRRDEKSGYVNIPYGHPSQNKCYCLYFNI